MVVADTVAKVTPGRGRGLVGRLHQLDVAVRAPRPVVTANAIERPLLLGDARPCRRDKGRRLGGRRPPAGAVMGPVPLLRPAVVVGLGLEGRPFDLGLRDRRRYTGLQAVPDTGVGLPVPFGLVVSLPAYLFFMR